MKLEAVGIAELDFGKWCTSAWIVNDIFYSTPNVSMSFRVIVGSELRRRFIQACVGRCENDQLAKSLVGLSEEVGILNMDPRPFL